MSLVQLINEERARGRDLTDVCDDLGIRRSQYSDWSRGIGLRGPKGTNVVTRKRRKRRVSRTTKKWAKHPWSTDKNKKTTVVTMTTAPTKGKAALIVGTPQELAEILRRMT